jgi:hypothetical protein
MSNQVDKKFIEENLILKNGNLNARALEKYNMSKELVYQIYHSLNRPALCKECQLPTKFISFKKGYRTFCSNTCVSKNQDIVNKKTTTLISNFGTAGFKADSIQHKKKKTSLANFGEEHPRKNKKYLNFL